MGVDGGSPLWGEGIDRVEKVSLGVRSWQPSIISMMAELEGLEVMLGHDGWEARAKGWGKGTCWRGMSHCMLMELNRLG